MSSKKTHWNEATRVQMPALVHLTRIGYTYFGKISEDKAGTVYDPDTNILIDVFKKQFARLNPGKAGEAETMLRTIRQELDNDDIGESFYKRLKAVSPVKLVDYEHPQNNTYHCTAEFTCKRDEDEFRPDITLFVNGLPLVFIEVKEPNNVGGMLAEADRMNYQRFPNKKFRRFINITQLMVFSNNMEYDAMGGIVPIQGAFYCTGSKKKAAFNCFREENPLNQEVAPFIKNYPYRDIDLQTEKQILSDFNNQIIHTTPEYQTNRNVNTPTNRILTSMCSPERLLFLLKYGITYYHKTKEREDGSIEQVDQKHILRYQQFFAAMIVRQRISEGVQSGIIWHTQGSGKTALSYHLSYVLTDYFSSVNKVAKYYFIVDRLDLLKQAKEEFEARGLIVKTANTRSELVGQFKTNQSQEGTTGEPEITVVNIQRFAENHDKVVLPAYATNLQRVFIIDEAHRGYKPEGSFLSNLLGADPNSIKIALTGTPLLKSERESWRVFGNYLHTYYYDKSVQDGYTLKIIREDIETFWKEKLSEIYDSLENLVQKKDVKKTDIIEHENYVKELLRYIISDLKRFRMIRGDDTLGGTQIFLYKFLNDKFGYELKKKSAAIAAAEKWETAYTAMSEDDRLDLLDSLSPDVLRLNPEHTISFLWNQQAKGDFDLIFDQTMTDIADRNIDIFSTQTTNKTKIPLFEKLTNYVTDDAQRAPFARALVDKLVNFTFEDAFAESYDFFANIFEYMIKDYNTNGGGVYAEYYTPHAIAVIMARLLVGDAEDLHNIECYDPAAGTGTLLMALGHQVGEDRCTIFAQDRSQKSNKMLKLNLILNGLVSSLDHAVQGDTLTDPFHKSDDGQKLRQFDFVVCNPPFKLNFEETREQLAAMPARFWAGVPKVPNKKKESMAIYTCFIQHVLNSLKDKGKGAIVLPTGFLTAKSGVEGTILKHIVEECIVYGVISMPSNVFANTGTNVSVVFFDNSRTADEVILIDASKLGEEYQEGNNKKVRLTPEEIDLIVDTFINKRTIDDFSVAVSYDALKEKNYSLSAGQYFEVRIEYVDITAEEFTIKMNEYQKSLFEKFQKGHELETSILEQIEELKYE